MRPKVEVCFWHLRSTVLRHSFFWHPRLAQVLVEYFGKIDPRAIPADGQLWI
jgi:hypothetical protein